MLADLDVPIATAACPIREEPAGQFAMAEAEPFRCDNESRRIGVNNLPENVRQRHGEMFSNFGVGLRPFSGIEIAGGP